MCACLHTSPSGCWNTSDVYCGQFFSPGRQISNPEKYLLNSLTFEEPPKSNHLFSVIAHQKYIVPIYVGG